MRRRMKNILRITCTDIDLTTVTDLEFYVKQGGYFKQYVPQVRSATEMLVELPMEDTQALKTEPVRLQFAFTDANGNPGASEIANVPVDDLLKEAGYDPA